MATNEGIEEDPLSCGDYSQFLDSAGDIMGSNGGGGSSTGNHLDEQSFMYSSFHSSKSSTMLCFGNNVNKEEKGFLERSTKAKTTITTNHHPISGVTGNSDSSSASSSNNSSSSNGFNTKSKRGQKVGETPKKREEERKNGLGTSEEPNSVPLSKNKRTSKKSKKETPTSTTRPVKVRKEKLGERITALQQLVSPFGKTDTASVLHEAMGYIRFLHDQVQVLCSPYLQKLPSSAHLLEGECGGRRCLRSRGLCLVPIEYTAYVANSNGADLWSPAAMGSNSTSSKH